MVTSGYIRIQEVEDGRGNIKIEATVELKASRLVSKLKQESGVIDLIKMAKIAVKKDLIYFMNRDARVELIEIVKLMDEGMERSHIRKYLMDVIRKLEEV